MGKASRVPVRVRVWKNLGAVPLGRGALSRVATRLQATLGDVLPNDYRLFATTPETRSGRKVLFRSAISVFDNVTKTLPIGRRNSDGTLSILSNGQRLSFSTCLAVFQTAWHWLFLWWQVFLPSTNLHNRVTLERQIRYVLLFTQLRRT